MMTTESQLAMSYHLKIQGAVQGAGFRPFVYRCGLTLGLTGWVKNTTEGVEVLAQGPESQLKRFVKQLQAEAPSPVRVETIQMTKTQTAKVYQFQIVDSDPAASAHTVLLPDLAMCAECKKEILDPTNRRYQYPFTNCMHCGPRFSIIEQLPYDRCRTTMKNFVMCDECRQEYEDPAHRRFHAQPNACPKCGPQVQLWDGQGRPLAMGQEAMRSAAKWLKQGSIIAIKGIGGFQLLADAGRPDAVMQLRQRKHRAHKPFAVMSRDLASLFGEVVVSPLEVALLQSTASPIVILKKQATGRVCPCVAPENPYLGVMLAYSPLHEILLSFIDGPVVATSGNVTDESICIDNEEAVVRLKGIADYFLVHDRGIVRQADDSLVRVMAGRAMILRRARGYAPGYFNLPSRKSPAEYPVTLSLGAHQKNTVAMNVGSYGMLSQHIGDLENFETLKTFKRTIQTFKDIYAQPLKDVVCDDHPDYLSSQYARQLVNQPLTVQHHYSHVVACLVEQQLTTQVLGVVWDGTGLGTDGTIWGGEFLKADLKQYERVAHFKTFLLPSGEKAALEPLKSAAGLLKEISEDDKAWFKNEQAAFSRIFPQHIIGPRTSSVGRLFDGVAALLGVCLHPSYEGQAAMALEFLAENQPRDSFYPFHFQEGIVDWRPMIQALMSDRQQGIANAQIAGKFHQTLIEIIVAVAKQQKLKYVVLTGGCFQNQVLLSGAVERLKGEGFLPVWHEHVPTNDGGIALGQLVHSLMR